ncbi:MAG: dTDP-glucose 4,6-dehydratase, partial [Yoonia sp.]
KCAFEQVDLRDKEATRRAVRTHDITHVMHLAAESHVDRSIAGPDDFIATNVVGTFNLLEACRAEWPHTDNPDNDHRFHHVSTDEVYGSLGAEGLFTETTPFAPNSPYSASKASGDMLVRSYHQTYGLNTVITHCSNNYGPYQYPEKLIPVVIRCLIERTAIPIFGNGLNVRDWLHVEDHSTALWNVLTKGRTGETYNIGGDNEWTNLRIVKLICDLVDELKPGFGSNSRALISHVKDRPGHDHRYAIDSAKIVRELGWRPQHTFESGIRETVSWYLDHQDWVREVTAESP